MGILDDAIREHLDLKRRRGADPSEVERLEREALGPVRRGGFEHDEDVLDSDYPSDARYEFEGEPGYAGEVAEAAPLEAEPDWVEPGEDQPLLDEAPDYQPPEAPGAETVSGFEPSAAQPRHHEIAEAWDAHEAVHGEGPQPQPATPEQRFEAEPAPPPPPVHAESQAPEPDVPLAGAPAPSPAGPTPQQADHPAEPAGGVDEETAEYDVEAAQEEDADDMLEETPDFLQDTPDHDRLWFEQRPPRDFDFEG